MVELTVEANAVRPTTCRNRLRSVRDAEEEARDMGALRCPIHAAAHSHCGQSGGLGPAKLPSSQAVRQAPERCRKTGPPQHETSPGATRCEWVRRRTGAILSRKNRHGSPRLGLHLTGLGAGPEPLPTLRVLLAYYRPGSAAGSDPAISRPPAASSRLLEKPEYKAARSDERGISSDIPQRGATKPTQ